MTYQPQSSPQNQPPQYVPQAPQAGALSPDRRPYANLPVNRSLTKYILIGIVTLGIYGIWVSASSGEDLNNVAGRFDGKRNLNYWLVVLLLGPITIGIVTLVWWHSTSNRIGNELQRRGQARIVGATDFWVWGVLGSLIIVGPFIFMYKWLKGMNLLCADFNQNG